MRLTKEEFKRKWLGGHTEREIVNSLVKGNAGFIVKHPSDRNITVAGKSRDIVGKNKIEKQCFEERADDFKHYVLDAVSVRGDEILDRNKLATDKLLNLAVKVLPQKQEVKMEGVFTFADMVKKAKMEENTIDI